MLPPWSVDKMDSSERFRQIAAFSDRVPCRRVEIRKVRTRLGYGARLHETANAFFRVLRFVGEDLFRIGIESRTGLAAAHGAEDGDSGEQAPLWNREPVGCCRWLRGTRVVDLAEHEEQIVTIGRGWIHRRLARFGPRGGLQGEDVESRENKGINNGGG